MNKTFSLLFYLRRDKATSDGKVPIYLRITIDGQKAELATKRWIDPERWDSAKQKASGTNDESKSINTYLKSFEQQVYDHYSALTKSEISVTAKALKSKILGLDNVVKTIVPVFAAHNTQIKALVGDKPDNYAYATWTKYNTTLKHIISFLDSAYSLSDIDVRKIDHEFITQFEFYLRSSKECKNNSAVKYVKILKKVIRLCIANGWVEKDPFVNYKPKVKEVDRIVLNQQEIRVLLDKEFATNRLSLVRDLFIFSCYTGLAYADVKRLRPPDIVIGFDGGKWIHINRKKTDSLSKIPLLPIGLMMIERYCDLAKSEQKNVFPVPSNQKVNAYLKEIADVCMINKELTFHLARHTFATTITLNNNVPIESVSKMLGHKSLKTTQHYAKVLDGKVSQDMKALKSRL